MFQYPVGRIVESERIAGFLRAVESWPAALVLDGEAGIGKSTVWEAGLQRAREAGMQVLSARAWGAESVRAWATVAELLADVPPDIVADLPEVQRGAVTGLLMRDRLDEPADHAPVANSQVLAAAMLSIIDALEQSAPVLIAIDDLQWLDPSSQAVIGFVARRVRRRTALLLTHRTDADAGHASTAWLHLDSVNGIQRMQIHPLTLGGLHEVIAQRLGRSFPRPTVVRIADVSGGNPFYALELARALGNRPLRSDTELPTSLADLVRLRVGALSDEVRAVLLATAATSDPTVEMISAAMGASVERTVELLESSEGAGVVTVTGNKVRFNHPLLARGVYTDADPQQRRQVHQSLADLVAEPELRARHLALAATTADPVTLAALDEAAAVARHRGAPAEAAELLELAIGLGADTAERRIQAADNHIRAGDTGTASSILAPAIERSAPGVTRSVAFLLRSAVLIHTQGYLRGIDDLQSALADASGDAMLTAFVRTMLAFAQVRADLYDEATANAREALAQAERLGVDQLISSALAVNAWIDCLCGRDYDRAAMRRALDLEAVELDAPVTLSASAIHAVLLVWTGEVEAATVQLQAVRDRLLDRGADTEMLWVSLNAVMLGILRGDYTAAAADARDTVERAERLGGAHVMSIALTMRGAVAAYTGDDHSARTDLRTALELANSCRSPYADLASALLAFLEVSVGAYEAALAALEPMLRVFDTVPGAEFATKGYLPDAVEALVALGRLEQAEQLAAAMEDTGRRLHRPWQLAVGARCRSMVLLAAGKVAEAEAAAAEAMRHHQSLAMPFERARTQLVCAQIQRRRRRRRAAEAQFAEALTTFEQLGAVLWARRAEAGAGPVGVDADAGRALTGTERRIAELAASGLTNREMAAELYVSPKTVEAHLTQVYRKLGIRSRAELGRVMGRSVR